tara:strand:- start:105 stop:680 length:576 start_codon:yes stop_codon:yes gene_type:complete
MNKFKSDDGVVEAIRARRKDIGLTMQSRLVPSILVPSTDGTFVNLSKCDGLSVVYAYPRTSPINELLLDGWDNIPGAKGCTLQSREFSSQYRKIIEAGAHRIFGLSTQDTGYQDEMRNRLHLPYHILSDFELKLTTALNLPTFKAGGMTLLSRLTLIINNGKIQHIFYPIKDASANPREVLQYLNGIVRQT